MVVTGPTFWRKCYGFKRRGYSGRSWGASEGVTKFAYSDKGTWTAPHPSEEVKRGPRRRGGTPSQLRRRPSGTSSCVEHAEATSGWGLLPCRHRRHHCII